MMHYPSLDPSAVQYASHSPNVTVMNRGPSAAAMQAAGWGQTPSCRYNPSASPADYLPGSTPFSTDPVSNFYQDTYRHPLISAANSGMPSAVYYPSHQMLMGRGMTTAAPTELNITDTSANRNQSSSELASPTDSLGSKGKYIIVEIHVILC